MGGVGNIIRIMTSSDSIYFQCEYNFVLMYMVTLNSVNLISFFQHKLLLYWSSKRHICMSGGHNTHKLNIVHITILQILYFQLSIRQIDEFPYLFLLLFSWISESQNFHAWYLHLIFNFPLQDTVYCKQALHTLALFL